MVTIKITLPGCDAVFSSRYLSKFLWSMLPFFPRGVRLSPLGTSGTNWSILPAPDDR
jgi:hypothetical protein